MDLEIYPLRIFLKVMKLKSFSEAARQLNVTQPTVSQQIGKLEAKLEKKLFERVGHEIIPTALAKQLLGYAEQLSSIAEDCENFLLDEKSTLRGEVRYAMPESCQWTPHFKNIMKQISTYEGIQFKIGILPTDGVARGIIEGVYDFGFVVGERLHPELTFEKFSDEPYGLVGRSEKLFKPLEEKRFEDLRLVTFPGWELFFTTWCRAHGIFEKIQRATPVPAVHIGTLAGAIHAVQEGAGVAVLPLQCVPKELKEFKLKSVGASNPIYVTKRVGDKLSRRTELVLDLLKKSKKDLG